MAGELCLKLARAVYQIISADTEAVRSTRTTAANMSYRCVEEAGTDWARSGEASLLKLNYYDYLSDPLTLAGKQPASVVQPIERSIEAMVAATGLLVGLTPAEQLKLSAQLMRDLKSPVEYATLCLYPDCAAASQPPKNPANGGIGGTDKGQGSSSVGSRVTVLKSASPRLQGQPGFPAPLVEKEWLKKASEIGAKKTALPEFRHIVGDAAKIDSDGDQVPDVADVCPHERLKPIDPYGEDIGAGVCGCANADFACNPILAQNVPGNPSDSALQLSVGSYLTLDSSDTGAPGLTTPLTAFDRDSRFSVINASILNNEPAYFDSSSGVVWLGGAPYESNQWQNPSAWRGATPDPRARWDVNGDGKLDQADQSAFRDCAKLTQDRPLPLVRTGQTFCDVNGDGIFSSTDVMLFSAGRVPNPSKLAKMALFVTFRAFSLGVERPAVRFSANLPVPSAVGPTVKCAVCAADPVCTNYCPSDANQSNRPNCECDNGKATTCGKCPDGTEPTKIGSRCVCNGGAKCQEDELLLPIAGGSPSEKMCVAAQASCSAEEKAQCISDANSSRPFPIGLSFIAFDQSKSFVNGIPLEYSSWRWNKRGVVQFGDRVARRTSIDRFLPEFSITSTSTLAIVRAPGASVPLAFVSQHGVGPIERTEVVMEANALTFNHYVANRFQWSEVIAVSPSTQAMAEASFVAAAYAQQSNSSPSIEVKQSSQVTQSTNTTQAITLNKEGQPIADDIKGKGISSYQFQEGLGGLLVTVTNSGGSTTYLMRRNDPSGPLREGEASASNNLQVQKTSLNSRGEPSEVRDMTPYGNDTLGSTKYTYMPNGVLQSIESEGGVVQCHRHHAEFQNLCEVVAIKSAVNGSLYALYKVELDEKGRIKNIVEAGPKSDQGPTQRWTMTYSEHPNYRDQITKVEYTTPAKKSYTLFTLDFKEIPVSPAGWGDPVPEFSQFQKNAAPHLLEVTWTDEWGIKKTAKDFNSANLPGIVTTVAGMVTRFFYDKIDPQQINQIINPDGSSMIAQGRDPLTGIPKEVTYYDGGTARPSVSKVNSNINPVNGVGKSTTTTDEGTTTVTREPRANGGSRVTINGKSFNLDSVMGANGRVNFLKIFGQEQDGLLPPVYNRPTLQCEASKVAGAGACYEQGLVYDPKSCLCKECKEFDTFGGNPQFTVLEAGKVYPNLTWAKPESINKDPNSRTEAAKNSLYLPKTCERVGSTNTYFNYKGEFVCGKCRTEEGMNGEYGCSKEDTSMCEADEVWLGKCVKAAKHPSLCEAGCGTWKTMKWPADVNMQIGSSTIPFAKAGEDVVPICPLRKFDNQDKQGVLDKTGCGCSLNGIRYATPYCPFSLSFDVKSCSCLYYKQPEVPFPTSSDLIRFKWYGEFGPPEQRCQVACQYAGDTGPACLNTWGDPIMGDNVPSACLFSERYCKARGFGFMPVSIDSKGLAQGCRCDCPQAPAGEKPLLLPGHYKWDTEFCKFVYVP